MGYRSKVIIGVKDGELSNEFDDILKKHDVKGYWEYVERIGDGMKFYTFEHIKWYETEDWCKEIMDWIKKQDDYTTDIQDGLQNVFCIGIGYDDGTTHSEIGDYWEYVERISEINLID